MQLHFHLQQFFAFALHHFGHWNACCAAHHFGNFFCANLGSQQPRDGSCCWVQFIGLRLLEELLQLRQFAVLQLSDLVEVAFARELFDLLAQLVYFFAHILTALGLGFFCFPNFFEVCSFFFEADNFFLNQAQTLLRSFISFFFDGLAFNLKLNEAAI